MQPFVEGDASEFSGNISASFVHNFVQHVGLELRQKQHNLEKKNVDSIHAETAF